jgi:uncharacterized phiE125 gp8 family phage protein
LSDATRVAGVAGTLTYTLSSSGTPVVPQSAPVTTIYSDQAMTQVAVAAATDAAGGAANAFLIAYPSTLAAGTYYIKTVTTISTGNVLTDVDDRLILVPVTGSVSSALVTLAEFKAHLKDRSTSTTDDAKLQGFLDSATFVIEKITGAILPRSIVEVHDGGVCELALRQRPVMSVASVTEYAGNVATALTGAASLAAGTSTSYLLDTGLGTVARLSASGFSTFAADQVVVSYTAGYSTVPANIHEAALFQAAHMFQSSQNGGRPSLRDSGAAQDGYTYVGGFAVPNRVRELLQPQQRLPGIA